MMSIYEEGGGFVEGLANRNGHRRWLEGNWGGKRIKESISSLKEKMHNQWWHNLVRPLHGEIVKDAKKLFAELEEAANDLAQDETPSNEPGDFDSDTE